MVAPGHVLFFKSQDLYWVIRIRLSTQYLIMCTKINTIIYRKPCYVPILSGSLNFPEEKLHGKFLKDCRLEFRNISLRLIHYYYKVFSLFTNNIVLLAFVNRQNCGKANIPLFTTLGLPGKTIKRKEKMFCFSFWATENPTALICNNVCGMLQNTQRGCQFKSLVVSHFVLWNLGYFLGHH